MVLRSSERILAKNLAIIRHNVRLLEAFLTTYSAWFEWVRPKAGAIAFIRFKGPLSSEALGAQLADAGIGIKPAYCFTDVVQPEADFFRVGYGESAFPKALEALGQFVEQRKHEWGAGRSRL